MYQKGYNQYKAQSVNTMTSGEMLVLLYDEMIKRLNRAELALENKEYESFDASVQRCSEIVQYLKDTLKLEYEVGRDLRRMYDFFIYELGRLHSGRKKEVIEELRPLVTDLRDAFKEAGKQGGAVR